MDLTLEELARRTGRPVGCLAEWRDRGLLGDGEGWCDPVDVVRVDVIDGLLGRGVDLDRIATVLRDHGWLVERFAGQWRATGGPTYSVEEAAERAGLPPGLVDRVWPPAVGGIVTQDDVQALRNLKTVLDAGLPEDALTQIVRVYAEAMGRVADAEVRLFHVHVHERLRTEGLSGAELMEATDAVGESAQGLIEPTLLYFHRRAWDQALGDDLLTHLAEEAGLWPTIDATGQLPLAVGFVDLSGFTSLTAAMGDLAAADVVDRFARIVREAVGHSPGQVVKQIGDGFMLTFPDATSALRCAVALEARISTEPQFPAARVGLHWGPVIYREGDYVGSTVNVAARVTAAANAHQVLVTQDIVDAASGQDDIDMRAVDRRRLRGLADETALYEAQPTGRADRIEGERQVDPVCRMELAPDEIEARLHLGGVDHVFCSTACLERFAAAPTHDARVAISWSALVANAERRRRRQRWRWRRA